VEEFGECGRLRGSSRRTCREASQRTGERQQGTRWGSVEEHSPTHLPNPCPQSLTTPYLPHPSPPSLPPTPSSCLPYHHNLQNSPSSFLPPTSPPSLPLSPLLPPSASLLHLTFPPPLLSPSPHSSPLNHPPPLHHPFYSFPSPLLTNFPAPRLFLLLSLLVLTSSPHPISNPSAFLPFLCSFTPGHPPLLPFTPPPSLPPPTLCLPHTASNLPLCNPLSPSLLSLTLHPSLPPLHSPPSPSPDLHPALPSPPHPSFLQPFGYPLFPLPPSVPSTPRLHLPLPFNLPYIPVLQSTNHPSTLTLPTPTPLSATRHCILITHPSGVIIQYLNTAITPTQCWTKHTM